RIGHVLDRVIERDDVEARIRQIEILETAGAYPETAFAGALRREEGDLHSLDIPTRGLRLEEEVAQRAAHVEKFAAPASAPFDRVDAPPEGPTVHVGVEEVVRVSAFRIVRRVIV